MEISDIGWLAPKPVKRLDDDVKAAPVKIEQQTLIASTKPRCAAGSRVCVNLYDRPSLFVGVSGAHLYLICD
jgi:hypothetical protein